MSKIACVVSCLAAALGLIIGPAATWLQGRERWAAQGFRPDAVYLVAGERDQNRRVDALVSYARRLGPEAPRVLVGNDPFFGPWSRADQRRLTVAEWGVRKIGEALGGEGGSIEIVPGRFVGTDGEMEALARFAAQQSGLTNVVVVTSRYHVRRVLKRLSAHPVPRIRVSVVAAGPAWSDRFPWVVAGETAKMLRDAAGLTRTPLLTRRGWIELGTVGGGRVAGAVNATVIGLLVVLAYAWIGYPLAVVGAAAVARRKCAAASPLAGGPAAGEAPLVTVILAAHNEEEHIAARIGNLVRATARTNASVRILVGSDGSADGTVPRARAAAMGHEGIIIRDFPERRGKVAVLKDLVRMADDGLPRGEQSRGRAHLLVFTDANTVFNEDALCRLLGGFADSRVGGVCGRLVLEEKTEGCEHGDSTFVDSEEDQGARKGDSHSGCSNPRITESSNSRISARPLPESTYWSLETRLKTAESALDSCLGANGAIYAIRRELFWSGLPDNTIVDDFVIGMKVREAGFRMLYDPVALATEELPETAHEWRRRVRIGAGDFQALWLCRRCLGPRYGLFAWMFASHKALRWLTPHLAIVLLAASIVRLMIVWTGGPSSPAAWLAVMAGRGVAAGFGAGVLCLAAAYLLRGLGVGGCSPARRLLDGVDHLITMQAALLVGSLRALRGNLQGHWQRTPRGGG